MDLDQLELFTAVYRCAIERGEGFAAVARERNLAPSSVSRAIASLETSLEARLFQRTTRKLEPTDAGEAFYRHILPLLEELEAARAEAQDLARGPAGRLRVTASVSYGQLCIVPRLADFRRRYPDIALELLLSDAALDLVAERIDLAVRHGPLRDSSLIARRLARVRYRVVASPDYLAEAPPIRRPADIADHPCIAFPFEGFRSRWRFRREKAAGEEERTIEEVAVTPAIVLSNAAAIRSCARQGLGPALMADWTVAADLKSGALVDVLPGFEAAGQDFDSAIWLVLPSRRFVPAKVRAFAEFLRDDTGDGY